MTININMNVVFYWILFGLIAGGIAEFMVPSTHGGIIGSIILGILGAIVGGVLGQIFFGVGITGFNLVSFALAIAGSLILLFIGRVVL
jgi:uncharacterized membrane protein YeaQ/YmgE (transglycosylase-associated protein family)